MDWRVEVEIEEMVGLVFKSAYSDKAKGAITFITDDGVVYVMEHEQECCESVGLIDICGDLSDLAGTPLLKAQREKKDEGQIQATEDNMNWCEWTFFHFATIKGYVSISWYGEGNGYYRMDAGIYRLPPEQ